MIKNTLKFAEWMHDSYESISEDQNWKTQKKCQVAFKNLPKRNQAVMIRMAERIKIQFHMFFDKIINETLKNSEEKFNKKRSVKTNQREDYLLMEFQKFLHLRIKKKVREEIRKKI